MILSLPHWQRRGFEVYSEYCNNHPHAVNEMCVLQKKEQYAFFFEVMCSEMKDISIPYCNFSQSMKDISIVSVSAHVPTKNAKSLTPSFGGTTDLGEIGIGAAR